MSVFTFSVLTFAIWISTFSAVQGQGLGPPTFQSDWLLIRAQDNSLSFLEVHHGLGQVPALVDILVKSTDQPNKDFIFKGIGNGERDDDGRDFYGGITYTYNEDSVRLYAPNRYNHYSNGAVIYTGEAPYWAGVNSQKSMEALVKVRCWLPINIGPVCFNVADLYMAAGSSNPHETFKEVALNLSTVPVYVNVRAKIMDGIDAGQYIDAQGSNMYWFNTMGVYWKTGGLVFGYNNRTVRIWTSSYPYPEGVLFAREDGWGIHQIFEVARRGLVEISVWCEFLIPTVFETTLPVGPGTPYEQLEVQFPEFLKSTEEYFVSVRVVPAEGPNINYTFSGTGAAMTNTYNKGLPCAYGGLVYAYSTSGVRLWRPNHSTGGALCIGSQMGHGVNSQASLSVLVVVKIWKFLYLTETVYEEPRLFINHYSLVADNTRFLVPSADQIGLFNSTDVGFFKGTDVGNCSWACSNMPECTSFATRPEKCVLYTINLENSTTYIQEAENDTQVWALTERYELKKDDLPTNILAKCWKYKELATSTEDLLRQCFRL